jgi:hypothetical protein
MVPMWPSDEISWGIKCLLDEVSYAVLTCQERLLFLSECQTDFDYDTLRLVEEISYGTGCDRQVRYSQLLYQMTVTWN